MDEEGTNYKAGAFSTTFSNYSFGYVVGNVQFLNKIDLQNLAKSDPQADFVTWFLCSGWSDTHKRIYFWKLWLRQDPLDLSFWSFLTFLHHGIEEVERHLLWKFHKQIQRKSWSNVTPKVLTCIGFLYKGVYKNGRLRKFNRSREI